MHLQFALLLSAVPDSRVFGLDAQTLISLGIQLFNTAVLACALTFILYKPVREFMRKRSDGIQLQLAQAQEQLTQAAQSKAQYEQKLVQIEAERAEIIESARRVAAQRSAQMLDEAKAEAAGIKEKARDDARREFERAREGLEQYILDISSTIAQKYIAQAMDKGTQDRLFDETMAELEEVTWLN